MLHDKLVSDLFSQIRLIPLVDPHSHINPHRPAARSLDDILGYHYYTELAHSAGMDQAPLAATADPRERVHAILSHMSRFDNMAQYEWFMEIARCFLDFQGERLGVADSTWLCDAAERLMAQPDWEEQVLHRSNLEKIFLTNDFDDPLEGFDTTRYVPCLRTDDLVFHLRKPEVRERLCKATNIDVGNESGLRAAIRKLFERFVAKGAKACAISLPPDFVPEIIDYPFPEEQIGDYQVNEPDLLAVPVFWMLAEHCNEFKLPFDLMIGVNRRVYRNGVYQGQDLFDQRTSLIQYEDLFNAFPEVTFPISVLTSAQNQELVAYSWIFPNVITNGHWWYSNIPVFIDKDVRARLEGVPKTKQLGYYSDAYKLEFVLPKYNMYRRILARILADEFVRPGIYSEVQALELARLLLRDNVKRIFSV
jgi:glucuronate isomerase